MCCVPRRLLTSSLRGGGIFLPLTLSIYHDKYLKRDIKARKNYIKYPVDLILDPKELFMLDILRGGIKNGDLRL